MNLMTKPGIGKRMAHAAHRAFAYWRRYGIRAMLARLNVEWQRRQTRAQRAAVEPTSPSPSLTEPKHSGPAGAEVPAATPVGWRTYALPPHGRRRVTVVADEVNDEGLSGGMGTALILGALVANRLDADLRVLTRVAAAVPAAVDRLWRRHGIELDRESQFAFAHPSDALFEIDLLPEELFITTSWQAATDALPAVPADQIVFLLQRDERLSCPSGDARSRCEAVFRHPRLRFIVNTETLRQHLIGEGFANLQRRARSFEPACCADDRKSDWRQALAVIVEGTAGPGDA